MDAINLLRYVAALLFVLALAGVAFLVKRQSTNPGSLRLGKLGLGKLGRWDFSAPERRLAVVETLVLGPKQRLLLIRRDNVEHLVLAGPDGASVIEQSIAPKVPQP
jgi:flagellar protein FliO/FliZ